MINKEKLELLHSIRGFAALLVVIGHAKFHFWSGGSEYIKLFPRDTWNIFDYAVFALDMLTSNPALMVIVFFVLSGFFIAYSFENNNWKLKSFYLNRTIRIYLPYLASIIFTIILFYSATRINNEIFFSSSPREYNQGLVENYQNFNFKTVMWNLIFVSNPNYIGYNDPYWSLLIEGFFYIIAPFFVRKPKLFVLISGLMLILGLIWGTQISAFVNFQPLFSFLTLYSFFFALGYLIFWLIFKYKVQDRLKRISVWYFNLIATITLLASIYGVFVMEQKYTYLLGGVFSVIMIYRMIVYPVKMSIINKFFISMGKISYSMYLIHVPIFIFMYAILVRLTGQEVFYSRIYWIPATIAVLVSYLFYWLVEFQSLRIIKWLKKGNI
jgi:peptidoglycan/LPS O-acetylase OafA/YrhL